MSGRSDRLGLSYCHIGRWWEVVVGVLAAPGWCVWGGVRWGLTLNQSPKDTVARWGGVGWGPEWVQWFWGWVIGIWGAAMLRWSDLGPVTYC